MWTGCWMTRLLIMHSILHTFFTHWRNMFAQRWWKPIGTLNRTTVEKWISVMNRGWSRVFKNLQTISRSIPVFNRIMFGNTSWPTVIRDFEKLTDTSLSGNPKRKELKCLVKILFYQNQMYLAHLALHIFSNEKWIKSNYPKAPESNNVKV